MTAIVSTQWQAATVVDVREETARAKTFRLRLQDPAPHRPGQHFAVRLTAPDGYTATRSYSVASAPDPSGEIELTVERLEDGEVSTFLHDGVRVGDELEVRGPLGGWFVWDGTGPALLVGGGSGVVPLMAMLRHARNLGTHHLVRLVWSVRRPAELLYAGEIDGPETTVVYTRNAPPGHARPPGRITIGDLPLDDPTAEIYVCGSVGFAIHVTDLLADAGVGTERIKVELFGPSG